MAGKLPGQRIWELLCHHQSHVEWVGCSLHDLIQPSFSFLVGVALPFSLANRLARGQSKAGMTAHALWRSLILVLLGVFLRSTASGADLLHLRGHSQPDRAGIYVPVRARAILGARSMDRAWRRSGRLLGGLRALSGSRQRFRFRARSAFQPTWLHHPTGFAAHWDKNSNLAWAFDTWFLNLFPAQEPFLVQRRWLRDSELHSDSGNDDPGSAGRRRPEAHLAGLGQGALALRSRRCSDCSPAGAWASSASARWSSESGRRAGCSTAADSASCSWPAFYAVLDLLGVRFWAFPLRVIGMNSIAAYCMAALVRGLHRQQPEHPPRRAHFRGPRRAVCSLAPRSGGSPGPVAHPLLDVSPQVVLEDLMR